MADNALEVVTTPENMLLSLSHNPDLLIIKDLTTGVEKSFSGEEFDEMWSQVSYLFSSENQKAVQDSSKELETPGFAVAPTTGQNILEEPKAEQNKALFGFL